MLTRRDGVNFELWWIKPDWFVEVFDGYVMRCDGVLRIDGILRLDGVLRVQA